MANRYNSFTVKAYINELFNLERLAEQMEKTYLIPFSYNGNYLEIKYISSQLELVRQIFFIAGAMISFCIVFNSIRILLYVTQQKKSFYGAALAMGMKRKNIRNMMFSDIALLATLSLILSSTLSIIAMHYFSYELSEFLSLQIEVNKVIAIQSFMLAIIFHALILLVSFLSAYHTMKNREITELIR